MNRTSILLALIWGGGLSVYAYAEATCVDMACIGVHLQLLPFLLFCMVCGTIVVFVQRRHRR